MAKLKTTEKITPTIAMPKCKSAPVKSRGKVCKVRNNIKYMKKNEKSNKLVKNQDQIAQPEVRLCFVKLKRALTSSTNSANNNDNALRDQCNNGSKKNENKDESKTKKLVIKELENNLNKVESVKAATKRSNIHLLNGIASTEPCKDSKTRQVDNQISHLTNNIKSNKIQDLNKVIVKDPKITPSTEASKRHCYIKLKRVSAINNKIEKVQQVSEPLAPITTRKCIVKLKNISLMQKTKQHNIKSSTSITSRKCMVQLKSIPMLQATKTTKELTEPPTVTADLKSDTITPTIPVIDNVKRNNFRKLSLNKSSIKCNNNREMEHSINVNLKNSQGKNQPDCKTAEANNVKTKFVTKNNLENDYNLQTILSNNNKLTPLEHSPKLSLKRPNTKCNKNKTKKLEVTQFDSYQNSLTCLQNAVASLSKDENKLKTDEKNNNDDHKRNAKNKSFENLINKSEEIENLLSSLDDDEIDHDKNKHGKIMEIQTNVSPPSKKTNKFFHRNRDNSPETMLRKFNETKTKLPLQTNRVTKESCLLERLPTFPSQDNVYEFLSQSQTSDSDSLKNLDPAADIIKRLIDEGRVRVATNYKGKGRPILKRKNQRKQTKKVKQNAVKKNNGIKNKKSNKKDTEGMENKEREDMDDNFYDAFDDNEISNVAYGLEKQKPKTVKKIGNNNNQLAKDQEGTFSRLARKVLINEAGRSNLQRQKAQRLLEMAKRLVSTPKNKKLPPRETTLNSDLSPIAVSAQRPLPTSTPWRVDEDAHLPRVFNFSMSSSNLPSFSSDIILSTPKKDKSRNITEFQQHAPNTCNQTPQIPLLITDNQNSEPVSLPLSPHFDNIDNVQLEASVNVNEQPAISSFSSNDSNAENMPPPKTVPENKNENDNIFNLKQLPNPRRTLNHRSPLKAINILEVVHLPPIQNLFKSANMNKNNEEKVEVCGLGANLDSDSFQANTSAIASPKVGKRRATNRPGEYLFGFEDFLSQTDSSSQEYVHTNAVNENQSIYNKLQNLRKLRPEKNNQELSLMREGCENALKSTALFVDDVPKAVGTDGMRQRDIKEMFCSTMIQPQPTTSKESLRPMTKRFGGNDGNLNIEDSLDISELFKDPESETTFNENEAHRTYIRPYKRKRRLKENKYVMFLDSDESGDEHDSGEHKKHVHSHESDTSPEKVSKRKRHRKEPKENPELTEFVEKFNKMCKEVDSYQLIVEKSA